jgi:putrescine aminotransferase
VTTTLPPAGTGADLDIDEVLGRYRRFLSTGRAKLADMSGRYLEVASEGAWVTTSSGERFLNAGGYGVFIHGARHPLVEAAVVAQVRTHPLATRMLVEPRAADAAEALIGVSPAGLRRVHFSGSGAEAVETAIKLARTLGKTRLVSTGGGYHGKTMGALSLTAKDLYQRPFRPLLPDVTHVRYGDAEDLARALAGGPPSCVVVEPVQGEAGVVIPPRGYLTDVARLCQEHGALFVLDEVLTGLGRLGTWWGAVREGVTPDVMLVGKALSGGVVPVAATVATEAAFRAFDKDPYLHTSTFSAAPIAMAAATAAIAAIRQDRLVERAATIGSALLDRLRNAAADRCAHLVREVRGVGLLIAVDFADPGLAGDALIELIDRRVIVNHSLNAHTVLRLTPPAVLTDADVDHLVRAFEDVFRVLADRYPHQPKGSR